MCEVSRPLCLGQYISEIETNFSIQALNWQYLITGGNNQTYFAMYHKTIAAIM